MSGLGYNIDGMFLDNSGKQLLERNLLKNPPKVLTVLSELNYAIRLKKLLPNTEIVYRQFWGNEFDSIYKTTSVNEYLGIYNEALKNGLICYSNNEPKISPELYAWEFELAKKLLEIKARGVLVNYTVGAPNNSDNDFNLGKDLFKLIGLNRGKLFLGFHEYWYGHPFTEFFVDGNLNNIYNFNLPQKDKPWIMARHRWMLNWCDRNNIKHPSIIITEYGWDDIAAMKYVAKDLPGSTLSEPYRLPVVIDTLRHFSGVSGTNWVDYTSILFDRAWRAFYGDSEDVLGVCFFPFGGHGSWDKMSIHYFPELVDKLSGTNYSNKYKVNSGSVVIGDYDKMLVGAKFKNAKWLGGNVNFRPEPLLNSKPHFALKRDSLGFIAENVEVIVGAYKFSPAFFKNEINNEYVIGWFAKNIPESKWEYK